MNIKGQGHSLTLVQGHSDSSFSNVFFFKTAKQIEAKFHTDPPRDGKTKVCSNSQGRITKMATMPIYGKNIKKIYFPRTKELMTLKVDMQHWVLKYYQVCSNYDPVLTLTYFTARSNFVPYAL